jgi:hypothetical protein
LTGKTAIDCLLALQALLPFTFALAAIASVRVESRKQVFAVPHFIDPDA